MNKIGLWGWSFILFAAMIMTAASLSYLRFNPTVVGNLCKQTADNPIGYCYEPRPAGGFPLSYLYDRGGVSVEERLGPEDTFVGWRALVDLLFFIVGLRLSLAAARLVIARRK